MANSYGVCVRCAIATVCRMSNVAKEKKPPSTAAVRTSDQSRVIHSILVLGSAIGRCWKRALKRRAELTMLSRSPRKRISGGSLWPEAK
jgi:hypothetical protein